MKASYLIGQLSNKSLQIEDMNSQAQLSAAQQLASGGAGGAQSLEDSGVGGDDDEDDAIPNLEAPEDDGPVDETGVDPKDIDLVMAQVSRCLDCKIVTILTWFAGQLLPSKSCTSAKREWR